jgi:hypothetical protein
MPDPDGKTGQIAVTNQGGTQIVVKPGDVTEVKDATTKPAPPRPMDEKGQPSPHNRRCRLPIFSTSKPVPRT